jgi:hypothetical protein
MVDKKRKVAVASASVSLLVGTMIGSTPPGQAAQDWTVKTVTVPKDSHCTIPGRERELRKLGPANVRTGSPSADTTFRDFKLAVGRPEEVDKLGGAGVTASYLGGHAGRFVFVSFGEVASRGDLKLQYGTLTGRRWVTEKGIRVGSTLARIKERYGKQAWQVEDPPRKGIWWRLAGHCGHPLFDGEIDVIEARIVNGRVSAFYVWVGAAGD